MFKYAFGPCRSTTGKPGSAFSKGDILTFTSASSLSLINPIVPTNIVGIALADSTQSIASEVPYLVADSQTHLWADILTTYTSIITSGEKCDIGYDATLRSIARVGSAATAHIAVAARAGSAYLDSTRSRLLVKILGSGADITFE